MESISVPLASNSLVKQGPDSPVSVLDFERKKSRSRSKGEFAGLYPPPRPPRKASTSPPAGTSLRRSQSQPLPSLPKDGSGKEGRLHHQLSANLLSELRSGHAYDRTAHFDSALAAAGKSSVVGGNESDGAAVAAQIEPIGCESTGAGIVTKNRSCSSLSMSPFSIWSSIHRPAGVPELRKTLVAQAKPDVEEVIVTINLQKVSRKDLQLSPRESRRLVLLFILFNIFFGGLLIFRFPRAGETGFLTPRVTRPEQLLNLQGNFGSKLQFYRRLVGPKERAVVVDPGATQKSDPGASGGKAVDVTAGTPRSIYVSMGRQESGSHPAA